MNDVEYWKKGILDTLMDAIYETLIWREEEGYSDDEEYSEYNELMEKYK